MNKKELILFLTGIAASGLIAWALSFTNIWQLVLFAGLIGGLITNKMGRGCLSSGIGVMLSWVCIMLYNLITSNSTALLDAFGGLLGLIDIGWLFYIIIAIFGFLFGVLGGAIGGGIMQLILSRKKGE